MADIGSTINSYIIYPVTVTPEWLTLRTNTDDGGEPIRRQKRQEQWTRYDLECQFFTSAPAAALLTFFNARKGGRESFTWTTPAALGSVAYTDCVFPDDGMEKQFIGPNYWGYKFVILAYT